MRTLKDKILQNVSVKDNGCWIWLGSITNAGYGQMRHGTKMVSVHRTSYEVFKGKVPDGLDIMHTCDVKRCANPEHLEPGTKTQNMVDAYERGRFTNKNRK